MRGKQAVGVTVVGLATLAIGVGCTVRGQGYVEPPPPQGVVVQGPATSGGAAIAVQPTLTAGVSVMEVSCTQGAAEQCNGLDDNCNGQIDEGCGYQTGAVQITLAWNTGADIDMYVTDPSGQEVSYQNTQTPSGGQLDHDARGQCRADQQNNRIENVYWNSPQPPSGMYQVALHYWGECGVHAGPTQTTLSIAVGGRTIGAYAYTLQPGQPKVTVATFNLP